MSPPSRAESEEIHEEKRDAEQAEKLRMDVMPEERFWLIPCAATSPTKYVILTGPETA
jgi:hypothetical protein